MQEVLRESMKAVTVNAIGDPCPIPVIKATKALNEMQEAGILEVHVDNEVAVQNLNRLANSKGVKVASVKTGEMEFVVTMTLEGAVTVSDTPAVCIPDARGDVVVAVGSNVMGKGDDALGATLMKGFLYAISQLEVLPKAVLFYNGGAKLTVEGALSVEDLKSMEAQGVEILTCGTCLNFYGLTDKLAVGSVTNMYAIVEKLNGASKVIRP